MCIVVFKKPIAHRDCLLAKLVSNPGELFVNTSTLNN